MFSDIAKIGLNGELETGMARFSADRVGLLRAAYRADNMW